MFGHYFRLGWRHLSRYRLYTAINIIGLAVGIASCLLIYLFIKDEFSFDRFHSNADRIFRPALIEDYEGRRYFNTTTPFPLAPTLLESIPDIEQATRVVFVTDIVKRGDKAFSERYYLADPALFTMFDFPLKTGDPASVLSSPSSVVLTERAAQKYFGSENSVGQTLTIKLKDSFEDFTVTGVAVNTPAASSIRFDIVISMANAHKLWSEGARNSWTNVFPETYVLARPGVTVTALEAKVPDMVKRVRGDKYVEGQMRLAFQPLTDIHLNKEFPTGIEPTSNPAYSYILGGVALAVLLIACINFVTLAVARAAGRAREVGIRKVSGAGRFQLLKQFWGETLLLSLLSLLAAIVLVEFCLPLFNAVAGKELSLSFDPFTVVLALGLVLTVSAVGGSYPGLVLARFQPSQVLKGQFSIQRNNRLRQALVIVQFSLAIALMICTLAMSRQFNFLQSTPIGYEREHVVVIPTNVAFDESSRIADRLRQVAIQSGVASHLSYVLNTLGEGWYSIGWYASPGDYRWAVANRVDYDFLTTMDIALAQGRNFSREIPSDTLEAAIVNEAFTKTFGIADPIGKPLPGTLSPNRIIGVVKDFHFASLHENVEPLVLTMRAGNILKNVSDIGTEAPGYQRILVHLTPGNLVGQMQKLERVWREVAGDLPFEPQFLDAVLKMQYQTDKRLSQMVSYASILVLVISSLGLFGLAAISVVKRTKEIGVRKVLGASSTSIVSLLSKEIIWLVAIANLVAWPLAYYSMQRWLADFAYRAPLSLTTFLGSAFLALVVALLTICYHAIKATGTNPVDTLRYE